MAIQMSASQFKEQCLSLLDRLDSDGLVITKHGKPVARVLPARSDCAELIGSLKGKIRVKGDTLSTGVKWNAES
ncbi:MAG: type II toxin-antitoxin system prevent-host-death family antitoxin [Bryobacteraceae bacterium]